MGQSTYLIVEQQPKPATSLPELLKRLASTHQLDSYQCRQRLIGVGRSLLAKGARDKLEKISLLLLAADYTHWLLEPSKPEYLPQRIRGLQINSSAIVFDCPQQPVTIPKGARVLVVFAEMSGTLAAKSVNQLLSSRAYRGRDDVRHLEEHKIQQTILQGSPLLDLYLLDENQRISAALRIFPGKFDPQGLGQRATLSSRQNLLKIIELVKEYAGQFVLQTDFGLVNLPGCTLQRDDLNNPDTERKNLLSLARYGWLLADLERVGPIRPVTAAEPEQLTGVLTAALLSQNPALVADGAVRDALPVAKQLAAEISAGEAARANSRPAGPITADPGLPPPPAVRTGGKWKSPQFWLGSAGAAVGVVLMVLLDIKEGRLLWDIVRPGFASGAIPFAVAGLMFWGGFHFVRLKRQIENTPTSRIRSIAMGPVEVKGQAIRQYALLSPMSHTPCVFYRLTRYRREKNQWQVSSVSSSADVPFLLEDETGRVEVNPTGCRVTAGSKQEGVPGQIGLTRISDDSDEKWCEELIVEGTLLYVLGFAAVKRLSGPTLSERKIAALRELKSNPQNLLQFDSDNDGKISADEWEAARAAVAEQVLHESLSEQQQRKKQEQHVVIGKKKGWPLVIAETHSEAHLTRRLTLYLMTLFIAAAVATVGSIALLLNYLP